MPELFTLLLKINIVLILFAAAYYLILRRLTFYSINRLFLAFGILFSTAYPFIDLTDFFHRQKEASYAAFVPELNQKVNNLVPTDFISVHWQIISALFYLGVFLMALRLVVQFVSLYLMHKKSKPGAVDNYPVRILNDAVSPFSFWQTVYVNPKLHEETELKTILAHEQIHVKEWHSLDIILAELSVVFYWFNPGVWLMKKAVKENLEFITDQKILNKGIDRKTYQYSLLDVGNLTPAVAIVNNFNLSDLKKRIKMMNVKRSSRLTLSRYLLVTPFLLITTLAFTVSKKDIKKHLMPIRQVLAQHHLITTEVPAVVETNKLPKNKKRLVVQETKPDTVGKLTRFFNAIFITTDSLKDEGPQLTRVVTHFAFKDTKMLDTSMKPTIRIVRGIKLTDEQREQLLQKAQSAKNLEGDAVVQEVTVTGFRTPVKQNILGGEGSKAKIVLRGQAVEVDTLIGNRPTIFVDGKKVGPEELSRLNAEQIKSVSVFKKTKADEEAVIVVGKKKP